MPAERNAFKLGLTLIGFFALAVGVLIFLAPRGGGDLNLLVRFPHNQFNTVLKSGSEVVCGGQTVGSVRSLDLREMEDPATGLPALYTLIAVRVDSGLGLRQDCRMVPEGLLLGGPGRLVILDRGVGPAVTADSIIDGQVAADFAALARLMAAQLDPQDPASLLAMIRGQLDAGDDGSLIGKIHLSLSDLNAVTTGIRNELDPRQKAALFAKLHGIFDHVNDATRLLRDQMDGESAGTLLARLHQTLDTLHGGLGLVVAVLDENREPITATIGHIRSTSQILEEQIAARIAHQLDPAEAAGLLAKVHVAIDRLGGSLEDVNAMTAASREVIVLNKEQLGRMLVNLKETSDHLKAASKDIRRSPWRLFYQPTVAEAAEANLFDAARAFSEAATQIDNAVVRLQALSEEGGAGSGLSEQQIVDLREQLQQTFNRFSEAETALWQQLKIR